MSEEASSSGLIPEGESCTVYTASCQAEADLIVDVLKAEGIPVMIESFESRILDQIFVAGHGWGEIQVLEKDSERARQLIAEIQEDLDKITLTDDEETLDE